MARASLAMAAARALASAAWQASACWRAVLRPQRRHLAPQAPPAAPSSARPSTAAALALASVAAAAPVLAWPEHRAAASFASLRHGGGAALPFSHHPTATVGV